jgi:hypothetical protein
LLEGRIRAGPTTLFDAALLNVLGVTHVLALPKDAYGAGLALERTLRAGRGSDILLLRNHSAWPAAVFIDEADAQTRLPRRQGCGHDRFFCADFETVVARRLEGPPIQVEQRHGYIAIALPPADTSRTVMLSTWYRPSWHASHAGVSIFPVFEQLMGIRIPPGVSEVRLGYWPFLRLWTHIAAAVMFLAGGIVLALLAISRPSGAGAKA